MFVLFQASAVLVDVWSFAGGFRHLGDRRISGFFDAFDDAVHTFVQGHAGLLRDLAQQRQLDSLCREQRVEVVQSAATGAGVAAVGTLSAQAIDMVDADGVDFLDRLDHGFQQGRQGLEPFQGFAVFQDLFGQRIFSRDEALLTFGFVESRDFVRFCANFDRFGIRFGLD